MRKYLSMLMAVVMAMSVTVGTTAFAADANGTTTIKVFHTNDSHSRAKEILDSKGQLTNIGFARVKSYIDSQAADGKLILDAGDTFHGQPFATIENGNSIAKVLKAVGYDAISPGNHDFNYGYSRLDVLAYRANMKLLAANITSNGKNACDKYMIKTIDDVKVGVFGLSTPETAYKTNPKNVVGLEFGTKESLIATSENIVKELKEKGCDVIIALCHLGIDETSDIKSTDIANVEGIDLIIDGHSHDVLDNNNKVGNTYIASTGEYLSNLGMVTITVSKDKKVTVKPEIIPASKLKYTPEDSNVKAIIDKIDNSQKEILDKVIGKTPIELDGKRENVRGGHTNLGRLAASSMLDESGAEIAITNGGGLRTTIAKGDITRGNVINVLPFGNYIVTKKVKGQDVIDALNFGMNYGAGSFPQFAGMTVKSTKETVKNEDGTTKVVGKVQSIMVGDKAIVPTQMYTVATNDFMAVGGDGYTMFKDYPIENEFSALDEALIKYIIKAGDEGIRAIDAEQRLIVTNEKAPAAPATSSTAPVAPKAPAASSTAPASSSKAA